MSGPRTVLGAAGLLTLLGCGGGPAVRPSVDPVRIAPAAPPAPSRPAEPEPQPILPPLEAYLRGWMPLAPTGIPEFLKAHPTYDGRGVLIAILDSGLDPAIPGLDSTTTGERKILDLRDFSGEGRIALAPVAPVGDEFVVGSRRLRGAGRLRAVAMADRYYAGTIAELALGKLPAADLNGDRDDADTLAVVVGRASDGWVLLADTDGDGTLEDERPVRDFLAGRETFAWRTGSRAAQVTIAANFATGADGGPQLDLYFDTSAHGSHVGGIAAAHRLYGVTGFEGVAPGAYLLGLKIANNAQGGISTTGSMIRAVEYAIRFAQGRRLPLVINMSFGVGNEAEGAARIDQMLDSVLALHPEVAFTLSAGNDGPGLSTLGYPGSASRSITVGATFPVVFLGASGRSGDPIAYFSSRGGELAKPDIVAPGLAYSSVPRWDTGDERKAGTSMAAPHVAGLVALLYSAQAQAGRPPDARQVRQALMVTARPLAAGSYLDDGTGQPDVGRAWRWLAQGRALPEVAVRTTDGRGSAAYRITRLGAAPDTAFGFVVALAAGAAPVEVTLRSGADWLAAPARVTLAPGSTSITLRAGPSAFAEPGVRTGVVTGWTTDTAAGPLFRLVTTVVVADTGATIVADLGRLAAGATARAFFEAMPQRPFAVAVSTRDPGEQVLAYLHEPGGQPYREESGIGAGSGEAAGVYVVDARDVVPGFYEAAVVAPPLDGAAADLIVQQSPVTIAAARDARGIGIALGNLTPDAVTTDPFVVLVGAERHARVESRGAAVERVRFPIPGWAVHAAVDVEMDRAAWPQFTDFGVTLLGEDGRQLGKAPLNYAFGRLHVDLPAARVGAADGAAEVALFPGLADPAGSRPWSARVSIRLYADSAHVSRLSGEPLTVPAHGGATLTIPMKEPGFVPGPGFVPLGIVVVPEDERTWTLEVPLPAPEAPLHP